MTKLSVIIPVHNTQKYLKRCIDSILMVQEKSIEIIIVDNNSDESYDELLKEYNDVIKYIKLKDNNGPGGARNIGISNSNGEFVAFCDSDDWVDSNFYDDIISSMEKTNADIGIGGIKRNFAYPSSERIIKCSFDKIYTFKGDTLFRIMTKEYDTGILIPPSSVNRIYKRKFLNDNNIFFYERTFYEDLLFSAKAAILCSKVVCVPNTYYHHFKRIGSITQSFTEKHIDDYVLIFKMIRNFLIDKKIYEMYKINYYKYAEHFFNLVIRQLFEYEQDEQRKKMYLKKAIEAYKTIIDFDEYIEINSSEKIRKHIQPYIEKTVIN